MAEPKFWCITSGKGGVGKTCLSVNLAFALADQGKRVLLVDGDLGLANVDVMLGLEIKVNVRDILDRNIDPLKTVVMLHPGLGILPASSGVPEMANLGPDDQDLLGEVLNKVAAPFDHVLIDTAAGLGPSVLWFNCRSDHSLVVVTPDPTALTDAYALIKVLAQQYQRRHFLVVLNNIQGEREAHQTFATLAQAAVKFLDLQLDCLGAIPADPAVKRALRSQAPFLEDSPRCRASLALQRVALRMLRLPVNWPESVAPDPLVHAM
jgi:flagellar biosynthesis protein FlhG